MLQNRNEKYPYVQVKQMNASNLKTQSKTLKFYNKHQRRGVLRT